MRRNGVYRLINDCLTDRDVRLSFVSPHGEVQIKHTGSITIRTLTASANKSGISISNGVILVCGNRSIVIECEDTITLTPACLHIGAVRIHGAFDDLILAPFEVTL